MYRNILFIYDYDNKMEDRKDTLIDIISDGEAEDVDGEMAFPMAQENNSSQNHRIPLDEPIRDTIRRDLIAVCVKFRCVLQPRREDSELLLYDWDLWGPLLLCTFMAVVLQGSSSSSNAHDGGPEFSEVFVIVWVGALVVTLNAKLLGGNLSIFQSVCALGYCLLAPAIALVFCRVILMLENSYALFYMRLAAALVAFAYSTFSCMNFLGKSQVEERKTLAGYPVCLFYAVICWLVVSHTG